MVHFCMSIQYIIQRARIWGGRQKKDPSVEAADPLLILFCLFLLFFLLGAWFVFSPEFGGLGEEVTFKASAKTQAVGEQR